MEQETLEVAARKYCEDKFKDGEYSIGIKEIRKQCELDFCAGADWMKKRSPWISVKERLPYVSDVGDSDYVLVRHGNFTPVVARYCMDKYFLSRGKECRSNWVDTKFNWIRYGITHWMPIPKFNQILEENRNVIKRIKEKGD